MVRRFWQQRESDTPIEAYLGVLSRSLRRHLPRVEADRTTAEIEGHLRERVEDLVEDGMDRTVAEAEATSGFGPAKRLAHDLCESVYKNAFTRKWLLLEGLLVSLLFARPIVNSIHYMLDPSGSLRGTSYLSTVFKAASPLYGAAYRTLQEHLTSTPHKVIFILVCLWPVLLVFLCAFMARQKSLRPILTIGAAATLVTFLVSGLGRVQYREGTILASPAAEQAKDHSYLVQHRQREVRLMETGLNFYRRVPAGSAPVPVALRQGAGYIVPLPKADAAVSLFKQTDAEDNFQVHYSNSEQGWAHFARRFDVRPYRTVRSEEEARQQWCAYDTAGLAELQYYNKLAQDNQREYDDAARRASQLFDVDAALYEITPVHFNNDSSPIINPGVPTLTLAFLLLWHTIAAALGRMVFRINRYLRARAVRA